MHFLSLANEVTAIIQEIRGGFIKFLWILYNTDLTGLTMSHVTLINHNEL